MSKHRDQSVELVCPIDLTDCGTAHSVRWSRESTGRVAMVSGDGKTVSVVGQYKER